MTQSNGLSNSDRQKRKRMKQALTVDAQEAGYEGPLDVLVFRKGKRVRMFDYEGHEVSGGS